MENLTVIWLLQHKFLSSKSCLLNSSHTLAYNPNARQAYEKCQHAEDNVHGAYTGVPQTCAKRVRSVFNVPVARMELIRNV